MKKVLLLLLLAVTTCSVTYAQKKESAAQQTKEVLTTVGNKAGELYDSTKSAVKNTATAVGEGLHYADTSSVSKEIYHDFKNGVIAMAEALKVGVEHVYKILCIQQMVYSTVYLLIVLILILVPLCYFKKLRLWAKETSNGENGAWATWVFATIVPMLAGVILFICTATTIITGYVNPEYGAMKDIVNMAQQVRNNPTQCQSCGR